MDFVVIARYQGGMLIYHPESKTFAVREQADGDYHEDSLHSDNQVLPGWKESDTRDLIWHLPQGRLPGCPEASVVEVPAGTKIAVDEERNLTVDDKVAGKLVNLAQLENIRTPRQPASKGCRYLLGLKKDVLRVIWPPDKKQPTQEQLPIGEEGMPNTRQGKAGGRGMKSAYETDKRASRKPQPTPDPTNAAIGELVLTLSRRLLKELIPQESSVEPGLKAIRSQLKDLAQATQRIESLLLADRQELEDALEFERKRAESLEAGFYSMESKVESVDLRVRREIENELRLVQVILDNYKGFELEDLKDKGPEAYGQLYEHAENMLRNLRQIQQILLENKLIREE